jgi:signal transduction histidine kinase
VFKRQALPIRVRLALATSGLTAVVCLIMAILAMVGVRGKAEDYVREQASGAALGVVHLIQSDRLPSRLTTDRVEAIQVLDADRRVVASTAQLAGKPPIATFRPGEDSDRADRVLCPPTELTGCKIVVALRAYAQDGEWIVYAAKPNVQWYVSTRIIGFFVGVSALLVLLTAVGTSRTVSRTLAPVDAIRAELAEITATESARRVPVPKNHDEMRPLAETVNATLDRLEGSLKQLQRFTSDASHDLRSPITAIRTRIEEALLYPDDVDWPATAEDVLESLDRLQAIVTDLLTLARLDAGVPRCSDSIDLPGLVSAELERSHRTMKVTTDLQSKVTVVGDRLKLNRLLTNLLDNAERHACNEIIVTVRAEEGTAVLEVLDDGTGIPPDLRETVFQRFARLDAARYMDANGSGLGLAIAREIARAHGGTLTIEDSPRGARFVMRIPCGPPTG